MRVTIELPSLHTYQQRIVDEARRFNVLACGRRFGKSLLGIQLDIEPALSGFPVAWFSPTHKMLAEIWRDMSLILKPVTKRVAVQEHRIELITGGLVDMWSLEAADSTRGRKYKRAVVDEAAMVPNFKDAWEAVIMPTLADYRGDGFWLSTPRGMNYFKQGFDWGQDPLKPEWMSWQFPSVVNPTIRDFEAEIELQRQQLPELTFRQEYLAEFLQSEGAVFRNVDACLIAPLSTPEAHAGHRIVMGIDWAMKEDFTSLSTFCATCKVEVELDRFNKIQWDFQRQRLTTAYRKWHVSEALAEENSIGSPNIEALQREHLAVKPFTTTASTKPPLIQSLALAFERNEAKWLPDPVAKAELVAYESKVNATTGRPSYSAPEGMHDDTVIARALAWWAVVNQQSWSASRIRF